MSSEERATTPGPPSAIDVAVLALLAAPFVVAGVAMLAGRHADFTFVADNAVNQLRIGDVGSNTPLIGPYSRDGWSHLGPAMYYLLAIPFRTFGSRSVGIVVGALLVNGASALGTALLARRLGGRTLMVLVTLAILGLLVNLGPEFVRDPWNPYLTVLPFGLLLFACWALADGSWWMLPVVAGVATFCVQTHVGYLPIAGLLVGWAVAVAALSARRAVDSTDRAAWIRPALITAGVLIASWLPSLLDQLTGTGNLNEARRHLATGNARGLTVAARVVGDAFTLSPGWLTGDHATVVLTGEPTTAFRNPVPWLGLALVIVVLLAWRHEQRTARLGVCACGVAIAASAVAIARTPGPVYDYRLRFLWVIGAYTVAIGAWLLVRAIARSTIRTRRPVVGTVSAIVAGVAVLVVGGIAISAQTTPDPPDEQAVARVDALTPPVLAALPRGGPYELRAESFPAAMLLASLAVRLDDAGRDVRVEPSRPAELAFGSHRLLRGPAARVVTVVVGGTRPPSPNSPAPAASRPSPRRATRRRAHAELATLQRRYAGRARPPAVERRIERLVARSQTAVVFVSD